ncbi:MAG: hypothetical protein Q3997_02945 [Propionibacteriaceae bacterium]|nr:hypothetical protein [Propionibacteriaceae bacterium]
MWLLRERIGEEFEAVATQVIPGRRGAEVYLSDLAVAGWAHGVPIRELGHRISVRASSADLPSARVRFDFVSGLGR